VTTPGPRARGPAGAGPRPSAAPAAPGARGPRRGLRGPGARGQGGQGSVWRARHVELDRPVALEVLHAPEGRAVDRFRQEARILARLDHPGRPRVSELGDAGGAPFLAMELIEGEDLSAATYRIHSTA